MRPGLSQHTQHRRHIGAHEAPAALRRCEIVAEQLLHARDRRSETDDVAFRERR